jgi:hypothetical protein
LPTRREELDRLVRQAFVRQFQKRGNSVLTLTRRYDNIVALSAAADWFTAPSRYGFRGQFDPLGDRVQMLMERLFTNHIAPDGFDYAVQGRGASIA